MPISQNQLVVMHFVSESTPDRLEAAAQWACKPVGQGLNHINVSYSDGRCRWQLIFIWFYQREVETRTKLDCKQPSTNLLLL